MNKMNKEAFSQSSVHSILEFQYSTRKGGAITIRIYQRCILNPHTKRVRGSAHPAVSISIMATEVSSVARTPGRSRSRCACEAKQKQQFPKQKTTFLQTDDCFGGIVSSP